MEALPHSARILLHQRFLLIGKTCFHESIIDYAVGIAGSNVVQGSEIAQVLFAGQASVKSAISSKDETDILAYFTAFSGNVISKNPSCSGR